MQLYERLLLYDCVSTHYLLMALAQPINDIFNTYILPITETNYDDYVI